MIPNRSAMKAPTHAWEWQSSCPWQAVTASSDFVRRRWTGKENTVWNQELVLGVWSFLAMVQLRLLVGKPSIFVSKFYPFRFSDLDRDFFWGAGLNTQHRCLQYIHPVSCEWCWREVAVEACKSIIKLEVITASHFGQWFTRFQWAELTWLKLCHMTSLME